MSEPKKTSDSGILIVEDEALIALDLKARLSNLGYTVANHVFSAEKALELIEQAPPDLILMDIITQGPMDGIEAAEIIRSRWGIPVVFTTAYADMERIRRAKLAYPFGYLIKPCQDRDLQITIEMAIYVSKADKERRRVEEESKLRSLLLDQVSDSVVLHDFEGRLLYVNEAAQRMRGYGKKELLEKNLQILATPQTASLIKPRIAEITQKGSAVFETENIRKDGTILPLEIHARLVDYQGEKAVLAVGRDLTERRRIEKTLRESEEKYRTLIDHTGTALMIVEADRTVSLVNSEFVKLSGFSKEEIEGKKKSEDFALPEDREKLLHYHDLRRKNPAEAPREYESRLVNKQGEIKHTYNTEALIPGTTKSVVSFNNITELKKAQEALRLSEEKYRLIAENSLDWIYLITPDQVFQYVSPACERITGYTPVEFMDNPRLLLEITHPEDQDRLKSHLSQVRQECGDLNLEFRLLAKSGDLRWINHSCFPVYNDHGRYVGRAGTNRDFSIHKKAQLALEESEERYRSLFEMSPSVVVVHIDEKIVLVNPAGVTLLGGKTEQDILGQNLIEQFFLPEYREVGRKRARIVNETGEAVSPREYRFRRLDGTIIDVEATGKAIAYEGRKAILSMYHDITERKRAEAAILESQGKYRQLVNYAPTGIYEIDYWNQRIVSVNDAMCQATGYTREELLSMNPGELLTDDSKPLFVERLQRILSNQPVSGEVEFKIKTKQGQEKWALLNTNFIYENGILRGATVVAHDITDRKKAEEDLLLSREIFSKAFEVSPDWISLSTLAEGRYIDVNNVYLQMTGRQRKEVVGRTSLEINLWADPRDRLKGLEIIREKGSLKNLEVKFRMKSGEIRDILWSAEVIDIKGQQCLLSVCHDITDRKKAEAEIRDLNITLDKRVQERTAQLEEANKELEGFSYSISHDLRTPLRHITGFVNLLLKQTDTRQLDEKSRHYLNVISDSAVKMGQLIDDLLSFSRLGRQEISRSQINLNILVGDVLKDIETEWENREVNWSIASLPEIYGDLPLLKIVFENLLSNALKFTRKKSRADIEIGTLSNPAEEVIIYVKDNGDGFNMAYGAKLFKLFQRLHHERDFEGTGLGLANVRRIINRHGGRTWAEGRPGLGATFYFSLPQRTSQR